MHRPAAPLDRYVDCLWHWDAGHAPAARERVVPSGALDIVIHLSVDRLRVFSSADDAHGTELDAASMFGASADAFVIETAPHNRVMGVHFRPGGARAFLDLPSGELEGAYAPLADLWGHDGARLRERLVLAPSVDARFAIMERMLRDRMREHAPSATVRRALDAIEDPRTTTVRAIEDAAGASTKRLLAVFRDEIGLTPKAFARVRRFHAALRRLRPTSDLASLALDVGYCDQPHFNRDFKRFTGLSPTAYLAHEIVRPSHVPLSG